MHRILLPLCGAVCLFYGLYRFLVGLVWPARAPAVKKLKPEHYAVYSKWAGLLLILEGAVLFLAYLLDPWKHKLLLSLVLVLAVIPAVGEGLLSRKYKK